MKIIIYCLLVLGAGVSAEIREKRQASYSFPGPRTDGPQGRRAPANYAPQQGPGSYSEEQDDSELYQVPRRQFQAQPVQPQYAPSQSRGPPAPAQQPPVYEAPRAPQAPAPRQTYSAPAQPPPRKKASASNRANKYGGSAPQQSLNGGQDEDEEVEQGPDPLTLLLQDSKFACGGKTDGYYADDSVNCQVFHYCVGGARHSWMCPEGTVFHQVHLNCVPDAQDICAQTQKFHFVNDYLYKPIDYQGPNNTARYSQRYYPDGYVNGDDFVAPQENQGPSRPQAQPNYRPQPQVQSYPPPAARPSPPRQLAPPPPPTQQASYGAPPAQPSPSSGYSAAPPRSSRPSRPAQSYPAEAPQGYRVVAQPQPQPQSPPPASYQPVAQDDLYQPQQQSRRPATPPRSSAGYAPPRQQQQQQQYRPTSARSAQPAQYPGYASNQAAGVQYDEDY